MSSTQSRKKPSSSSPTQSTLQKGGQYRQPALEETSRAKPKLDAKQRAKAAHSRVEKRYRENLNAKLTLLHTTLQNTRYGCTRNNDDSDSEFDFDANINSTPKPKPSSSTAGNSKFRKSDVLSDAMNYVHQTEVEMRHMENEILRLNERASTLEKLVRCEDCGILKNLVGLEVQPV
jgi:hypothetical protein